MSKFELDLSKAEVISSTIIEGDTGGALDYTPEELIPGLVLAIQLLAEQCEDTYAALNEADELLVNGFGDTVRQGSE